MPAKMLRAEKKLDKALPKSYPGKSKEEIKNIKWGILKKEFKKK